MQAAIGRQYIDGPTGIRCFHFTQNRDYFRCAQAGCDLLFKALRST
jgi:hypothetical protein